MPDGPAPQETPERKVREAIRRADQRSSYERDYDAMAAAAIGALSASREEGPDWARETLNDPEKAAVAASGMADADLAEISDALSAPRPSVPDEERLEAEAVHLNVCPDCGTADSGHMLDPPPHCPHGYERFVPEKFVRLASVREHSLPPVPDEEYKRLFAAYEALVATKDPPTYQVWTLAEKALNLARTVLREHSRPPLSREEAEALREAVDDLDRSGHLSKPVYEWLRALAGEGER